MELSKHATSANMKKYSITDKHKTMTTTKFTLQEIFKHGEGKECESYFNPLSGKYEAFISISNACAMAKGKRLIADSNKIYLSNISIIREYQNGVLTKQIIYSH